MNRRTFFFFFPTLAIAAGVAQAQGDPLAAAFSALSPTARRSAQEQLATGGFYDGKIDGAYGARTRSALINAAAFIKDNSYGRKSFELSSSAGASGFVTALSKGELATYLWGEGDESASS